MTMPSDRLRTGVPRRNVLRIGALGLPGLTLPHLLAGAGRNGASQQPVRAKSCILFYLEGGPSHIDLWDMKPLAPAEVRGDFRPISSTLSGEPVCEHLPMMAQRMHQFALVRSVHHRVNDHNAGTYYALTGRSPIVGNELITRPGPDLFPPFGSVMAKLFPNELLPEFVHIPEFMFNNSSELPGEFAGFLGPRYDPFVAGDPSAPGYKIPGLGLQAGLTPDRLQRRRELHGLADTAALPRSDAAAGLATHYERAYALLDSPKVRDAFDVSREPAALRERYGLPDRNDRSVPAREFGGVPHLGQSLLLARRLIESGVRLVTVCTGRRIDQTWDTHRDHFPLLKQSILPYADRAFSALMEDLTDCGLLEETLVVAMGEFGRTPRLGQITSGAGADAAGRDHWPHCYTVMLAGAGIQSGAVYGSSDAIGGFPQTNPVTPEDIAATIYAALGLDPHQRIHDSLDRPHDLATGRVIEDVLG